MSVLDQFREAEQRVAQRLKELEPAVAEYRELQEVAKRLGIDGVAATAESPPTARARRPSRSRGARAATPTTTAASKKTQGRSRRRAAAGGREQQLLELVRVRPGVTVREAGAEFGVDPTSLYRVVQKLEKNGQVRKTGRALEPVTS